VLGILEINQRFFLHETALADGVAEVFGPRSHVQLDKMTEVYPVRANVLQCQIARLMYPVYSTYVYICMHNIIVYPVLVI
jgi:hypothetical protein